MINLYVLCKITLLMLLVVQAINTGVMIQKRENLNGNNDYTSNKLRDKLTAKIQWRGVIVVILVFALFFLKV